jgi:hypothetical protein
MKSHQKSTRLKRRQQGKNDDVQQSNGDDVQRSNGDAGEKSKTARLIEQKNQINCKLRDEKLKEAYR